MKRIVYLRIAVGLLLALASLLVAPQGLPASAQQQDPFTYAADFSTYPAGQPAGWDQFGTPLISPYIGKIAGFNGLVFPRLPSGMTDKYLISSQFTCTQFTATVKYQFWDTIADGAGLVIAWGDGNNHISILPNIYWRFLEFNEFVNGAWRTRIQTPQGSLPISYGTPYWLRVSATVDASGSKIVTVYWSTDGTNFRQLLTVSGLVNLSGRIGLQTSGVNLPEVSVDSFTVNGACQSSSSSAPAQLAQTVVGDSYLSGGKGWDFQDSLYVSPTQIQNPGYTYWNSATKKKTFAQGLDCSGLVMWSYNRSAGATQFYDNNPIQYESADSQYRNNTIAITESQLQPGDLLFFDWNNDGMMDHVAMYIGGPSDRNVVQAATLPTAGIQFASKDTLKGLPGFKGYGRVVPAKVGVRFIGHSPIDLVVTDPDGYTIGPSTVLRTAEEILTEIPGVLYYSQWATDSTGRPSPMVTAPTLKTGDYFIQVVPKAGSASTDTYSLDVQTGGTTIALAQNVPVGSIPPAGYVIRSTGTAISPFTSVAIEIKPGSSPAPINLGAQGLLSVAILSTPTFDATKNIDPKSVTLAGAPVAMGPDNQPMTSLQDVNGDGLLDLVVMVKNQDLQLSSTASKATLQGLTYSGTPVAGIGAVRIVPPSKK